MMTKFSKLLFLISKEKVISFLQRQITAWFRSFPTCLTVQWKRTLCGFVGVKDKYTLNIQNDTIGGINEIAPTGESRQLRTVCTAEDLDISTVAHSVINFNSYARCYV
jgi:hypothetical protein